MHRRKRRPRGEAASNPPRLGLGLLRDDVASRQAHPLVPAQDPQPADRLASAKREGAAAARVLRRSRPPRNASSGNPAHRINLAWSTAEYAGRPIVDWK